MISWNHSKKQPMPRIAVVGTGTMGSAMAVRLLDAGMEVSIWSRQAASTMPLVDHGATAYEKPADAVLDADVVITMLPTAKATADVMLDDGALLAMTRSSIWIQMATLGVETTKRLVTQTRNPATWRDLRRRARFGEQGSRGAGSTPHSRVGPTTCSAAARTRFRAIWEEPHSGWVRPAQEAR